ncbi:MAG: outer membrane beta-barrel protein [Alphaproteobacteria bacterium]|nr:outer membrane beta-barrel protein [Alphaproteobacteria bacterium]
MLRIILAFVLAMVPAFQASAEIYISGKVSWADIKIGDTEITDYTPSQGAAPNLFLLTPDSTIIGNEWLDSVRGNVAVGFQSFSRSTRGILRIEAEYGFGPGKHADMATSNPAYDGNPVKLRVKTSTWFLNGYYDMPLTRRFRPYLGTGVGFAKIKSHVAWSSVDLVNDTEYFMDDSETIRNFAYNIGGGIAFVVSQSFILDFGYRYNNLGQVDLTARGMAEVLGGGAYANSVSEIKYDMISEEVLLGLRYVF